MICTHKEPNNTLGVAAGLKTGSTGGLIVDERMATSVPGVFAAGDCTEIPHGLPACRCRASLAAMRTQQDQPNQ